MASVQKAEVKAEIKAEPKEQRDASKVPIEKPSSPKSATSSDKKESKETNPVKKDVQPPNKTAEQSKPTTDKKDLDKKNIKEASETKKNVQQIINKFADKQEQDKVPIDQKNQEKPDVKVEKKDVPSTSKSSDQKVADLKQSSSDKTGSKKPNPEKSSSGEPVTNVKSQPVPSAQTNPEKPKTHNGNSANKDAKTQVKIPNDGSTSPATKEKTDKDKPSKETTNVSSESKEKAPDTPSQKTVGKGETSQKVTEKAENIQKTTEKVESSKKTAEKTETSRKMSTSSDKSQPTSTTGSSKDISSEATIEPKASKDADKTDQTSDKNNNETDENSKPKEDELKAEEKKIPATKYQLRYEIWDKMFRSASLAFRTRCNYRIPHFKGDVISAGRLSTMELFQNAKVVKVSLDKAQECVRLQVIEAGKEMIVGCPGLREAVFLHVKPPMEPSKSSNKLASSRIGIGHVGTALDFSSGTQADLVIVGSVAVDKTGLRVGKGEGFADLEYALLKKLGGIAPDAPIITVVHDSQVYDTLPEEMFKDHDVPADYIVTPTQVIEITPKRKHPDLIWNILSNRRVNSIPIVKQLLDREQNRDGAVISLKDEDTDTEDLAQIARRKRYFMRRRTYSSGSQRGRRPSLNRNNMGSVRGGRTRRHTAPSERGQNQMMMPGSPRPTRTFRNRIPSMSRNNYPNDMKQNGYWMPNRMFQNGGQRRNNFRQMFRPKYSVDFSLKVQGLTNGIRVRDLKQAVSQRGIRPRDISWLPHKGMAFLHFSKPRKPEEETPMLANTDSVLASLRDLTIKAENGPETNLKVEPAQPFRKVHFTV